MVALDPRRAAVEFREEPCRSALNPVRGMGFRWSLNPYTGCEHRCSFCYVRAYELRADRPADDRYGRSIRVKVNVAGVLRAELARRSWKREAVVIGAATDPYQPAEGRYRLTRSCLQALRDFSNPCSIITRGPMIVRDLDVLAELARRADFSVNFSIPTLDLEVWRRTEPGTAPPRQRLRALTRLVEAGLKAGVGMAPLLPGISDRPEQLEAVIRAAREAGATHLWAGVLHLRSGVREHFMAALERHWPELVPRYRDAYAGGAYLPGGLTEGAMETVHRLRDQHRIADRRAIRLAPPPEPQQLELLREPASTEPRRRREPLDPGLWAQPLRFGEMRSPKDVVMGRFGGLPQTEIARRTVPCYKRVLEPDGERLALCLLIDHNRLYRYPYEEAKLHRSLEIKATYLRGDQEDLRLREFQPGLCRYVKPRANAAS